MVRRKTNNRKRNPLDEASTIEEVKEVEKHRFVMFVARLFTMTVFISFSSIVFAFLYMTLKNKETPSLEAIGGMFGHFFSVLGVIVGS